MRSVWGEVSTYLAVTPTYTGGLMAITRGSPRPVSQPILDAALERGRRDLLETQTYTPDVHQAAYALPAWIRAITDGP